MSPNQSRMDYISEMIDEYQVDGVIELILQACHTYAIESYHVKKTAAAKGVPYLKIETDYSTADSGQIKSLFYLISSKLTYFWTQKFL